MLLMLLIVILVWQTGNNITVACDNSTASVKGRYFIGILRWASVSSNGLITSRPSCASS